MLHSLLSVAGLMAHKEALVHSYSKGRTGSSKELSKEEAYHLISYLKMQAGISVNRPVDRMRKKLISRAEELGWEMDKEGKRVADMQKINNWALQYGYLHKPLNSYSEKELPRLLFQFEKAFESYLRGLIL